MKIAIVGAGRAGTSFARALAAVGHEITLEHHDDVRATDAELVLLCVPDRAVAETAARLETRHDRVVAHVAGALSLEVLAPHPRVASLHPLAVLSSGDLGAARLRGAHFRVAGDEVASAVVASLGGAARQLHDDVRVAYHATACVAANHVVALLAHVEALARSADCTLDDFLPLVAQALEDVATNGAAAALTGPAARGDLATIHAHLAAIPEAERATYGALASRALELAGARRATQSA